MKSTARNLIVTHSCQSSLRPVQWCWDLSNIYWPLLISACILSTVLEKVIAETLECSLRVYSEQKKAHLVEWSNPLRASIAFKVLEKHFCDYQALCRLHVVWALFSQDEFKLSCWCVHASLCANSRVSTCFCPISRARSTVKPLPSLWNSKREFTNWSAWLSSRSAACASSAALLILCARRFLMRTAQTYQTHSDWRLEASSLTYESLAHHRRSGTFAS